MSITKIQSRLKELRAEKLHASSGGSPYIKVEIAQFELQTLLDCLDKTCSSLDWMASNCIDAIERIESKDTLTAIADLLSKGKA